MTDLSDKESFINGLERVIEAELQKSPDEIDEDLVDECLMLIAQEKGIEYELSEEEKQRNIDSIINSAPAVKQEKIIETKRRAVRKRAIVALVAALVLICSSATACAIIPKLRNWLYETVFFPFGTKTEDTVSSMTYIHLDKETSYSSIEELVKSENLNILYPGKLPDGVKIKSVELLDHVNDSDFCVQCKFTDSTYSIIICDRELSNISKIYDDYCVNDVVYHIVVRDDKFHAFCNNDNYYYSFRAPDYDSLLVLINNVKGK